MTEKTTDFSDDTTRETGEVKWQMMEKTFKIVDGDLSDGYHTFGELYQHRILLFLAFLHVWTDFCTCDDKAYYVPDHYEGWDLIVAQLPTGQISYHVPIKYRPCYDYLTVYKEAQHQWDGHTPGDVCERLWKFMNDPMTDD